MRRFLLSAVTLTGLAVVSQFAGAGEAQAQPVVEPGLIHQVQYWDWRRHERHEYWRWRRHDDWRRRHWDYRHHW